MYNIHNKRKSNKINEKISPFNLWSFEVKFFELRDRWDQGNTGWDCFGQSIVTWNGRIPGPKEKIATSMHLYIWAP